MHGEEGPLYCETFVAQAAGFPIEPLNTWTSLIPAVAGLLALWWLWRQGGRDKISYLLATTTFFTGVGSVLWHGLRTDWALTLDVLPGLLSFLLILVVWPARLGGRFWSYGVVAALFALMFGVSYLFPQGSSNGPPLALFGVVSFVGLILVYFTYTRFRAAAPWASLMMVSAIAAATFRTVDLATCESLPYDTHFLWHIFLSVAAYSGVRLLTALKHS